MENMEKTLPAKHKALFAEQWRLDSKYGRTLKTNTHANILGQMHNISHFKNVSESNNKKVILQNYDHNGKRIKFIKHGFGDSSDLVYVPINKNGRLTSASGGRFLAATEYHKMVQDLPKPAIHPDA